MEIKSAPANIRSDRTYIITGGLSGFGLEVAQFLCDSGANFLVLASRHGKTKTEAETKVFQELCQVCKVVPKKIDISEKEEVVTWFEEINADPALPDVGGIFHSATVYADASVSKVTEEKIVAGMGAKALGALHLDEVSRDIKTLEHFVLFSSISNMIGNEFQCVYAAANGLLEGLATNRHQQGLPGLAIAWGSLKSGFLARRDDVRAHNTSKGMPPMPVPMAMECLRFMLSSNPRVRASPFVMASLFDFDAQSQHTGLSIYPQWFQLWSDHRAKMSQKASMSETPLDKLRKVLCNDKEQGLKMIREGLEFAIRMVLELDHIDHNDIIPGLAGNSMLAMPISIKLAEVIGVKIPITQLLGSKTIASLADTVAADIKSDLASISAVEDGADLSSN